jgi:hypothetical protein
MYKHTSLSCYMGKNSFAEWRNLLGKNMLAYSSLNITDEEIFEEKENTLA